MVILPIIHVQRILKLSSINTKWTWFKLGKKPQTGPWSVLSFNFLGSFFSVYLHNILKRLHSLSVDADFLFRSFPVNIFNLHLVFLIRQKKELAWFIDDKWKQWLFPRFLYRNVLPFIIYVNIATIEDDKLLLTLHEILWLCNF